jgi:hypothetical protein
MKINSALTNHVYLPTGENPAVPALNMHEAGKFQSGRWGRPV